MDKVHHAYGMDFYCKVKAMDFPKDQVKYLCANNEFFLNIPGVATYHVDAPLKTIYIDINPLLTNFEYINTWLYGTVLAYLLQFHNYLVLHGSAILYNNRAVIFSGNSGIGKSTLAYAISQKGYPVITDDLIVIRQNKTGVLELMPGKGHVKLWDDALLNFGVSNDNLTKVQNKMGKYIVPVPDILTNPTLMDSFYELNVSEKSSIDIMHMNSLAAFKLLMRNTYRYAMLSPLGKLEAHFLQISQLTKNIKVFSITRPTNLHKLDDIIGRILC